MSNRRNFIKKSALGTLGVSSILSCDKVNSTNIKKTYPRIISTWNHGLEANQKAWEYYDLIKDPYELKNEFYNPKYKNEILKLHQELIKQKKLAGDIETLIPNINEI